MQDYPAEFNLSEWNPEGEGRKTAMDKDMDEEEQTKNEGEKADDKKDNASGDSTTDKQSEENKK